MNVSNKSDHVIYLKRCLLSVYYKRIIICLWSRDGLLVRVPDPLIERLRVRIPPNAAGEFSSPGLTLCADSLFGVRSTPVLPQWHVKDAAH